MPPRAASARTSGVFRSTVTSLPLRKTRSAGCPHTAAKQTRKRKQYRPTTTICSTGILACVQVLRSVVGIQIRRKYVSFKTGPS
jgi:hypothetical protein